MRKSDVFFLIFPKQALAVGVLAVLVRGEWDHAQARSPSARQLLLCFTRFSVTYLHHSAAKVGSPSSNTVKHNENDNFFLQMPPDASSSLQMPPDASRGLQMTPRCLQMAPDASQMPPPDASQMPPSASRCLPDASRCLLDASRCLPRCLPDASQTFPSQVISPR